MRRLTRLTLYIFFPVVLIAQQNPDPSVYYGQPKTIREIAKRSLREVPDSADLAVIFTPKYALRARRYFRIYGCWWKSDVARDTLNPETANTVLVETQVWTFTPQEYCSRFSRKLDSLPYIFQNRQIKIYDIDRGDGSHWAYYARNRTYVNGHWVCLNDLWGLLLAIHDSELSNWKDYACTEPETSIQENK